METVSSHDGTTIAYDTVGEGPPLILVDGALSVHSLGGKSELAKLLAPHFTVYGYDRRGRGGSGDTLPYAVDREIEDIEGLIDRAGGSAFLYGHSSGATLAMRAAVRLGRRVSKIALYEAPHSDDPDAQESWTEYLRELGQILASGRRGDAVAVFMRFVGTPDDQVEGMRQAPFWPSMEAIAPTLAYDHAAIIGRALVGADRPGCAGASSGPGNGGRGELAVHAPHGPGAEQGDAARPSAAAGGSDSQRGPRCPRSGPGGLLYVADVINKTGSVGASSRSWETWAPRLADHSVGHADRGY